MDKPDLTLVPLDDLVKEIFNRCHDGIIVTSQFEADGAGEGVPIIRSRCKEHMSSALGLLEISKSWMLTRCLKPSNE